MNRRGFLIASAAPLVVAPAAALASLDGVAEPFPGMKVCIAPEAVPAPAMTREALLDRYVAFLAHEHRMALWHQLPVYARDDRRAYDVPMFWLPDHDAEAIDVVNDGHLFERAPRVLAAVGL